MAERNLPEECKIVMLSITIEESRDQGNSVRKGFLVNPGSQDGATGGTEGPVDSLLDPAFAMTPGYKVLPQFRRPFLYKVSVEQTVGDDYRRWPLCSAWGGSCQKGGIDECQWVYNIHQSRCPGGFVDGDV